MTTTNGSKLIWWILGIVGTLLVAGVAGSVVTYASTRAIGTNLQNLRSEIVIFRSDVRREFDAQERDLSIMDQKLDRHIQRTTGGETP